MKIMYNCCVLLVLFLFLCSAHVNAQCSMTALGQQDKLLSAFHGTIATKAGGGFEIWGERTSGDGATNILSPVSVVTGSNSFSFAGTPVLMTMGSHDIGNPNTFLLTTQNLYMWGTAGVVVSPAVYAGGNTITLQLPINPATGVKYLPSDIKFMDACTALVLVTISGDVWVRGNYIQGQANPANASQCYGDNTSTVDDNWHHIKTNAAGNPYLTGIVDARTVGSQIFMVNSSNQFFTCGYETYLGDGSSAAQRYYATQMTSPLPAGITPKQIDCTGGHNVGDRISYFVLGSNGLLYSMGDNQLGCLGIGSASVSTTWQTISGLTGVTYLSANNHDSKFASVAVITTGGALYLWGGNDKDMIDLTTPVTSVSSPTAASGLTVGVNVVKTVEVGGHSTVIVEAGSDRYCYVGHLVDGSMGNGSSIDATQSSFDCMSTGSTPPICGATSHDFGDAPVSYDVANPAYDYFATSYNGNAATYLCLGVTLPSDDSAAKSVAAGAICNSPNGDGAEEDGVSSFPSLAGGLMGQTISGYTVNVFVHNTMGAAAIVGGWIDWNGNGIFESTEGVVANVPDGTNGNISLAWPSQILTGTVGQAGTYARFRVTTAADGLATSDFGGAKNFGEVEDYYIPFITLLPINLISFTGYLKDCSIVLNWTTATETNGQSYEIETSANGIDFFKIGELQSQEQPHGATYSYKYVNPITGNNIFRLKAIDFDGKYSYSNLIDVKNDCATNNNVSVAPNPAHDAVIVFGLSGANNITILDLAGKKYLTIFTTSASQVINTAALAKGIYIVNLEGNNKSINIKLLKD